MKWIILTCDNSKKIVPAQKYLIDKYITSIIEEIEVIYVDLKSLSINSWSNNVLMELEEITKGKDDDYVIFGLDDFLPIDFINKTQYLKAIEITKRDELNRFELGWGASKKDSWIGSDPDKQFIDLGDYLEYGKEAPYSTSCQFSIWNTKKLKEVLSTRPMTPWEFEVKTKIDEVGCFESDECALRYIEESAISARQKGLVNILGLKHEDVDTLVENNLLRREELIYSWRNLPFSLELAGSKYKKSYAE